MGGHNTLKPLLNKKQFIKGEFGFVGGLKSFF